MNKFIKAITRAATVLFIIGIGIVIFGAVTGGSLVEVPLGNTNLKFFSYWNNFKNRHDKVFTLQNESGSYHVSVPQSGTHSDVANKGDITSLDFDIGAADCTIVYGDDYKFESEGKHEYNSRFEDNKWKVSMKSPKSVHMSGEKVVITIPENVHYNKVEFSLGAGNFQSVGITTDELDVELGAGNFKGENYVVNNKTEINCGAANFEISGAFNGKNDLECGAGRLKMVFDDTPESYDYNVELGLGKVKLFDHNFAGIIDKKVNNGAKMFFDIDCSVGYIEIE